MSNPETEYSKSLSLFYSTLNELGNYVVLDDIKNVLLRLNAEDIQCGFYKHFVEMVAPYEVKRNLELLSDSCRNYMNRSINNESECSQRILKDLNAISLKEIETIGKWQELSLLFGLSSVRKLESNTINAIIYDIKNENRDALRDMFDTFLKAESQNIRSELKSHKINLNTLISEVIEKIPKLKYSFSENFNKEESYFMNKIINLNDPCYENYRGSIQSLKKNKGFLKFYTHNSNIFKINEQHKFELIEIAKKSLFFALMEDLKEGSSFKIEISKSCSEETSNKLEVGKYILSSRHNEIIKEGMIPFFKKNVGKYTISITSKKTSNNHIYTLTIKLGEDISSGTISIIKKKVLNGNESKKNENEDEIIYKDHQLSCLKNTFQAVYKNPIRKMNFVSEEEVSNLLQITENNDETNNRLIQVNKINEMIDNLRNELITPKNRNILESFLNNLVSNKLKFIEKNFLQENNNFFIKAYEICENYRKYLSRYIEPNELIKEVVIDANYILHIEKEQSLEISKTMELLKDAYKHIDKLRNKKLIFFLGNTGSGKSTTVSYLLGAELKQFINKVGEKVFEIDFENSNDQIGLPKIGQSLGESETIYTQGYLIDQSQDIYLADCPGFNDTRGGHYELCSNLSIDQVIKNSQCICSLVIVLPIHSFLIDRGNPIIEFVGDLNDRFLNIFSKESEKSSLFIIITKCSQINHETAKRMKDGTRFSELLRESDEKLTKLKQEKNIDILRVEAMQKRNKIWNTFYELNIKGQIEYIDVLNMGKKRDELIAKYTSLKKPIDKNSYAPLMESSDMKQKFGKSIELSVHTWRKLIIHKFLNEYPEKRKEILIQINEIENKIKALLNEKVNKQNIIEEKKKLFEENLNNLDNFEKAKNNPDSLTQELENKLVKDADQYENEMIQKMEIEIKQIKRNQEETIAEIDSNEKSIKVLNNDFELSSKEREYLLKNISKLEEGDYTTVLYENRKNPDDTTEIKTIKDLETIQKAFLEDRVNSSEEIIGTKTMKYSEMRGKYYKSVVIEKNYMLVPVNTEDRNKFKDLNLSLGTIQSSGFIAHLESHKYDSDVKGIIEPSNKKIRYLFSMNYDSGSLPWIKITFTIPNKIHNEAEIINRTADISAVDAKLLEIKKKIERKKIDLQGCVKILSDFQNEISFKENQLDALKKDLVLKIKRDSIEKIISKIKEMNECLKAQILQLEDFTELDKNLKGKENEMEKKEAELEKIDKEFRNLSIIILTQIETAEMLRNLSNLIADNKHSDQVSKGYKPNSSMKESVILECVEYISSYDQNIKKIVEESKRILNLDS